MKRVKGRPRALEAPGRSASDVWARRAVARLAWVNGKELLRLVSFIGIYPVGWIAGKMLADGGAPRKRPLVLLHGFWHNRSAFLVLLHRLREEGWTHVWTLNLALFWGSIEKQAARLEAFIEKVREETDSDRVDVLGHSLGGLIAWWYLSRKGGEKSIRRLVALGTPFQGTEAARVGMGRLAREMLPRSPTIKAILSGGRRFRSRVTSIYSADDLLVRPKERARLPGARNVEVAGTGHLGLLYSREVFAKVELALSQGDVEASP